MSTQTPTPPDTADWLISLASHLMRHPHLAASASYVRPGDKQIQMYPHGFEGDHRWLRTLVAWADSLAFAGPIEVTFNDGADDLHMNLVGQLGDGTSLTLTCLPGGASRAALAELTALDKGDTFDVDVVFGLLGMSRAVAVEPPKPSFQYVVEAGDDPTTKWSAYCSGCDLGIAYVGLADVDEYIAQHRCEDAAPAEPIEPDLGAEAVVPTRAGVPAVVISLAELFAVNAAALAETKRVRRAQPAVILDGTWSAPGAELVRAELARAGTRVTS